MRISDWSSDVCSSDLYPACVPPITKLWRVLALGGSFPTCTGGGIAKTKYKKPDDGRPGRLTVTWTDGRQQTYYQPRRSEEHTSELQSLMRNSYAVFCLKKKKTTAQSYKMTNSR